MAEGDKARKDIAKKITEEDLEDAKRKILGPTEKRLQENMNESPKPSSGKIKTKDPLNLGPTGYPIAKLPDADEVYPTGKRQSSEEKIPKEREFEAHSPSEMKKRKPNPIIGIDGEPRVPMPVYEVPQLPPSKEKKAPGEPMDNGPAAKAYDRKMSEPVYYVDSVRPGKAKNPFREGGEKYPDTYIVVKMTRGQYEQLQQYDERIQAAKARGETYEERKLTAERDRLYKQAVTENPDKYTYTVNNKNPPLEVGKTMFVAVGIRTEVQNLVPISPEADKKAKKAING